MLACCWHVVGTCQQTDHVEKNNELSASIISNGKDVALTKTHALGTSKRTKHKSNIRRKRGPIAIMFPAVRRWSPSKKASQLSFEWCGVGIHRKSRHMAVMFLVVRRCSPSQNALHDTYVSSGAAL